MSIVFVDLQGFIGEKNRFIPKELAAFNGHQVYHYIFKSPFPFRKLKENLQKTAKWLMMNHHCIDWGTGITPLCYFKSMFLEVIKSADIIYVKGKEKANFLRKLTNKEILEFQEQPPFKKLGTHCTYHKQNFCICALSNVLYLYKLYINKT